MAIARTHLDGNIAHLSVTDWENLINEIPLNDENKIIAKMRFIDEECLEDISARVGYSRKTISNRIKYILGKIGD